MKQSERDLLILKCFYSGRYFCDANGGIYSLYSPGGFRRKNPKLLIPGKRGKGYPCVALYVNTRVFVRANVHRAIYLYFKGKIPNHLQINHINGVKTDNRLENLELVSPSDNLRHAFRMGLKKPSNMNGRKGSKHNQAKLKESHVLRIRSSFLNGNLSTLYLAEKYGVSRTTINHILSRKTWSHI